MSKGIEIQKNVMKESKNIFSINANEIGSSVKNRSITLFSTVDSYPKKLSSQKVVEITTGDNILNFKSNEITDTEITEGFIIAKKNIVFQNKEKEKEKFAEELIIANKKLKIEEEYQKEYIRELGDIVFLISHKIRQPVAHILGLSKLLDGAIKSPEELNKIVSYLKTSAQSLDDHTRELIAFIHKSKKNSYKHVSF